MSVALQVCRHNLTPRLSLADNGTECQQPKDRENKGPLGVIKSCAHFLFTGPSIYPLIE